ncbi:MAG: hypothetical protein Q8858_01200 [Bacteroidota bacterium]|nr:hypothetical protein [Bacteroidota bacterium]
MWKFILISVLAALAFSSSGFPQDDFEKFYSLVQKKPQIHLSILNGQVQVFNIYKQEVISVYNSKGKGREERIAQFIKDVYFPYEDFWNGFFDEQGFKEWTGKNWENLISSATPGFLIPFQVDFDSVFTATAGKLKQLTGRVPEGKWYLIYGNKAANMGGLANIGMFADFFGIGGEGYEQLLFALPHEINHQIMGKIQADDGTLLCRIINEGFSCFVNYLYWDKKISPAKNIGFTDKEWQWCINNENKIYDYTKGRLDSTDDNMKNKFARAHRFIFDGAPDRIAYFIGFRICQAYINNNGAESWKDIYNLSPGEVFRLSGYEKFMKNNL